MQRLLSIQGTEAWAASNIALDGRCIALFMVRTPVGGLPALSVSSVEQNRSRFHRTETTGQDGREETEAAAEIEVHDSVDRRDPSVVLLAHLVDALLVALAQARFTSEDTNVATKTPNQARL